MTGLGRVDVTKHYIRRRQKPPGRFDPRSFRVKTVSKTMKLVVACPKGEWKHGRCQVGMQVQSVLRRRKGR